MMTWVYLFSQFTPEALLFEATLILVLICGYCAFWILKKRKYGAIRAELPSGPVKAYLDALILNAEQVRIQLFGLAADEDAEEATFEAPAVENSKQASELQAKINEQAAQIATLIQEKSTLVPPSEGGAPAPTADTSGLQSKITELEEKLQEYSVIEDDLANLKRLQQENAQLKATLAGNGNTGPAAPAAAPPAAAEAAPEPTPEPVAEAPTTEPAAPIEPEAAAESASAGDPLDEVEDLLADAPEGETALAAEVPPTSAASPEADLIQEFEKLLG